MIRTKVNNRTGIILSAMNIAILILMSITFIFPFWRAFVISLNDGLDSMKGGVNFWPREFTLMNYRLIFSTSEITNAYKVTIARTVIGTFLSLFLMALMAYGLSKRHLKLRRFLNVFILVTMYFSGGLIPYYLLIRKLGLYNNFLVYIIPTLYSAWYVILMRTFFQSLPSALEESAKIDGANDAVIFFRIIFPLSMPIFATIFLFTSVGHWNDWFLGAYFISNKDLMPLQSLLMNLIKQNDNTSAMITQGAAAFGTQVKRVTTYSIRMTTLVVTMLPILCVYPFLQKYFVKGVMVGSIKG